MTLPGMEVHQPLCMMCILCRVNILLTTSRNMYINFEYILYRTYRDRQPRQSLLFLKINIPFRYIKEGDYTPYVEYMLLYKRKTDPAHRAKKEVIIMANKLVRDGKLITKKALRQVTCL